MNKHWEKLVLSNVAKVELCNVDKKIKPNEKTVRQCNYTDVYKNWQIDESKASTFLNVSCTINEYEKFKLQKGQVAITKDSETRDDIGISAYIAESFENTVLGYHLALITPNKNKIDGYYLNCLLKTKTLRKYFENNATGSGQRATLSIATLRNTPITIPCVTTQQAIAKVLSQLDEKIELNNKINAELENIAKTIYDYWFIQFDFPNAEGKPYKSSGGEMVYNPTLKREIPKGWTVKKMSEIVSINNIPNTDQKDNVYGIDLSIMPSNTMCLNTRNNAGNFATNQYKMKKYDILFGSIRPYLRKAGFAPFDGVVNGTVHSFSVINEKDYSLALLSMVSEGMFTQAITRSVGTKMPVIRSKDLLTYKLPYSDKKVALFHECVKKYWELISQNIQQNFELAELRDFLLPMLMNGQVTVEKKA